MQMLMSRFFQMVRQGIRPMFHQRPRQLVFTVQFDREADGRWLAEVEELPGVMAYGSTHEDAVRRIVALTLHVLADKLEHGEAINDRDLPYNHIPPVLFQHQQHQHV